MSKTQIQVAYENDDPASHTMDVEQLAPSLLAIGNLCKRANTILNGDKAIVRVLVESDFKRRPTARFIRLLIWATNLEKQPCS